VAEGRTARAAQRRDVGGRVQTNRGSRRRRSAGAPERAGLDVVNDGEQRRLSFLGSLVETTEGLSRTSGLTKPWHDDDQHVEQLSLGLVVTGKLRRRRSMVGEEFAYARAKARKPLKVTLPTPTDALNVLVARGIARSVSTSNSRRRRGYSRSEDSRTRPPGNSASTCEIDAPSRRYTARDSRATRTLRASVGSAVLPSGVCGLLRARRRIPRPPSNAAGAACR